MTTLTLRLEAYSKDARQLISAAQQLADERKTPEVEPLHLLYRMIERDSSAQQALSRAGVDPADMLLEGEALLRRLPKMPDAVAYLSPRLLDLLGRAEGEAARDGGKEVSVAHLLVASAQETAGAVPTLFRGLGLSAPLVRAALSAPQEQAASGSEPSVSTVGKTASSTTGGASGASGGKAGDPLELYGRDLTRLAAQGKFDPTVGRDAELRRILQVLARRRENNPLLVGEPGIGKSCIVQALAARIATGDVPTMLTGKRIVQLETSTLVAGAKLRGELEERMRSLLDAVRDSAGQVIVALPDLSTLVGERGPSAAGDMLAAALARGEVRVIAITTPDELRKAFDKDSSLSRRFVVIPIEPPTADEAIAVLRGIVERYEIAHGVRIADPSLVAAVRLARRYVPSVQLPKSAIDLIDEGAARVRVEMESLPSDVDALGRRLDTLELQRRSLEDDDDADSRRASEKLLKEIAELRPKVEEKRARWQGELKLLGEVRRLKEELTAARREEDHARTSDDQKRAEELRFGTLPLLEKQVAAAEAALTEKGPVMVHETVTEQDIADVVAAWTGVPVSKMLETEAEKLLKMEDRLGERVIGQQDAVRAVSRAVRRGRVGLRDPRKPIGSFLFLGPTGVGKTELAKALAEFLFDDEASLTRLDMSEFMEKHTVARLLGSPPGYVDSDEGGFLTEAVRRRPYSVVLFDELEKAHQDVFNILLQVLDDGRLTDSRGRLAHFSETVIIMTSNIGGHAILDHDGTPDELRGKVQEILRTSFRPEFLNRIDDVVIFDRLTREDLAGIAEIQLRGLGKLLAERRIGLEVTPAAKARLVDLGYEPAFGARPLKRVILKNLQDPLAEEVLRGGYAAGDVVRVDVDGERFVFAKRT